ncbi:hypothetical protein D3C81_2185020 [compost metagenome]
MRRRQSSNSEGMRMGRTRSREAPQGAMQAGQFSNLHTDNNKNIVTTAENR